MPFNLRKSKGRERPIDFLREIDPDLRYDDLDMEDKEVEELARSLGMGKKEEKVAVHGRGDNWTEISPGEMNYSSPTIPGGGQNWAPEFGGRWRNPGGRSFPGSGDQHINDDSDKEKSLKGHARDDDFDPKLKRKTINDKIEDRPYRLVVRLDPDTMTEEVARDLLGKDISFEDGTAYLEVDGFDKAIETERKLKSKGLNVSIEPS